MQTKRKGKLWAFLVLLCMLFQLAPASAGMAAEVSEEVINGEEHAEFSLSEIFESYEHTDPAEFYEGLAQLAELAADEENAEAAKELYDKLDTIYGKAYTMRVIASIATRVDATDMKMAEEDAYNTSLLNLMRDRFCTTVKDILDLPGSRDIVADFTDEDREFFSSYEEMTEEQLDAVNREQALIQEYSIKQLEAAAATVEINGTVVGFAELEAAAAAGMIDADTYYAKHMELAEKQNALLGEVYLRLVKVRREIASLYGYDNYNNYMYEAYGRDYTPDEIQAFSESVKTYLSAPYFYMQNLMDWNAPCLGLTYDENTILETISTYLPQTSVELQDAVDHLISNKLYDIGYSDVKMAGAFTTYFPYYNTECIVMQPNFNTYDLLTMVHEFGHFNANYQKGSTSSLDVAEVQSQGLEFLFMEHYEDIFGDSAPVIEEYVTLQQVYSFISGCMNNELETWAYTQEDLTLDALNAKNAELLQAYEQMQAGSWTLDYYSKLWVQTHHFFLSPCYYISYATSVAGAFAIREVALENPIAAVNSYLAVATAETDQGFSEVMEDAGLGDVLSPEQIQAVGEGLMEYFNLEQRFKEKFFPDQGEPQTGEPDEGEPDTEEPGQEEPTPAPAAPNTCHVRSGDTLAKIGKRFQVDWKEIAKLNGIKAPYKIYAGQELILPENAVLTAEKIIVQKGDTLGKIAAALGLNWMVLAEQLGLEAPYTIYAGEELEFIY